MEELLDDIFYSHQMPGTSWYPKLKADTVFLTNSIAYCFHYVGQASISNAGFPL